MQFDERPEFESSELAGCGLMAAIFAGLVAFVILAFFIMSCGSSRIIDASPAITVSYEKVKHSTNYLVKLQDREGNQGTYYWNSHCWNCNATVPMHWNIIKLKNGNSYSEEVK